MPSIITLPVTIIGHGSLAVGSILGSRPPVGVAIGAAVFAAAVGGAIAPAVPSAGAATTGAAFPADAADAVDRLGLGAEVTLGTGTLGAPVPALTAGAIEPAVVLLGEDTLAGASCSSAQATQMDIARPYLKGWTTLMDGSPQ